MSQHVLIVHPDAEMREQIHYIVDEVGRGEGLEVVILRPARNQAEANERAKEKRIDLVITALEIAASERMQVGAGEECKRGIALIRELRSKTREMAAILITGHVDNEVYEFTSSEDVGLVPTGGKFEQLLPFELKRRLCHTASEPKRIDIEITLNTDNSTCIIEIRSEGIPVFGPKALAIDARKLRNLVDRSRSIEKSRSSDCPTLWKDELRQVGEALSHEIFKATPGGQLFKEYFDQWVGRVGFENIRIRFTAQDELHPIVLEALKKTGEDYLNDDYLMLETPIYRLTDRACDPTLFETWEHLQEKQARGQPLNLLIIQADTGGEVRVAERHRDFCLESLPGVKAEVEAITTQMEILKQQGKFVGDVRVICQDTLPPGQCFTDEVKHTLENGHWDVVHYAGHTHYEPDEGTGYVFFPGSGQNQVQPVKIDLLALWLRRSHTRFIFLSSCRSAEQDFIYHLAKEGIPAVMGFLWKVDDAKATEYADTFYNRLFRDKERSLEYACLEAKREMHARYEDNPIWASPVLLMQVGL